ncbi:septal ring lytic transglycosylase RlpA family protein [Acetobacter conturbans]|uniref:RlpA-like protein double-psi beta-barrel domain-containing protein n=1 Tax=Acetobacter conturbans TaxID=1737472 RepID=A0ABX0JWC7_9PROT|nr:RlpA-like double-psi beta-barrel domain-containing protein [Acetobacter conturbans]NHN87599.1 hypothetical protein [Acetobacter conturbans]
MNHEAGGVPHHVVRRWLVPVSMLLLASCHKPVSAPVTQHVHYEVGPAYHADGVWLYPRQEFAYRETGLAVVDSNIAPRVTGDGELYDPKAMTGAHPTLQLPVQVTVRNLDNGRQITIRLNDRGPVPHGRLLSITPQAAVALGMGSEPTRVEVIEDDLPSRTFAETLPGGPLLDMTAAPVGNVEVETLGVGAKASPAAAPVTTQLGPRQPVRLPDLPVAYMQSFPTTGSLWIEVGRFTRRPYAEMEARTSNGTVQLTTDNSGPAWAVRVGPFQTVNEADTALDRALALGLTGAHIVVE